MDAYGGVMKRTVILIAAALGLGAGITLAQDAPGRGPGGGPPDGPRGPRGPGPGPAIVGALDANKDGKLDASEIANATAALKTLDKNNDGELSRDEIFGPRPADGRRGAGQRPGRGPRPQQP